jgi:hypothetical protein
MTPYYSPSHCRYGSRLEKTLFPYLKTNNNRSHEYLRLCQISVVCTYLFEVSGLEKGKLHTIISKRGWN